MSKVWVVFVDYAYAVEPDGYYIAGVFDNYEQAKELFDSVVEKNKAIDENNKFDKFEQDDSTYNAWVDGEYNLYHTTIILSSYELNKVYKEQ